ncbi:MAG: Hsp20/alpha crystallin family protein [Candidatus Hodarchaeota archaeon]
MCQEKHHGPHVWAGCGSFSPKDVARMKRMAGHFMRNFMGGFGIPYNIEDLGNEYLIVVPLPGRTKDDVEVSLINKNINIKAGKPKVPEYEKREEKPKEEDFPFPWKGFRFIDVNMDIPLPVDADEETISSRMSNGLLRITMGKKPAKHIDINEGGSN